MTKVCNTCNEERPIRFFHKQNRKGRKPAYRGKCSICYSTYRKEKDWDRKYYLSKKNC